jgi:hypothetical protein
LAAGMDDQEKFLQLLAKQINRGDYFMITRLVWNIGNNINRKNKL